MGRSRKQQTGLRRMPESRFERMPFRRRPARGVPPSEGCQRRMTRSEGVIESMNAGRENRRSAYVMSGAAAFGSSMP